MTTAYTVTVLPEGTAFASAADRSVLHGMEQSCGRGIQVGCRSGGCGVCRITVLSGTYTTKRMSKAFVTEDDLRAGVVLSCRTYPTSDLTVQCAPKPAATAPLASAETPRPD